jgi:DNA-binding MarR family transcriptional regulator
MLTSGAITYRIDEMVKTRLVQRSPGPEDRRGLRTRLTALGRRTIDAAVMAHVENEANLIAHLSAKERSDLAQLLRKLLTGLEQTRNTAQGSGKNELRSASK